MGNRRYYLQCQAELERYCITSKLGEGGFGQVYQGWDSRLDRDVAVKILPSIESSLKEAQILAQLDHPNIAKIYDLLTGHQHNYLVMEYIEGSSILNHSFNLEQILQISLQVLNGLVWIHEHDLLHLDIKPQNLLWDPYSDQCKITDFGTAATKEAPTGKNDVVGTPKFMAPEQREGRETDVRTDIYSFGKVICYLIEQNKIDVIPAKLGQVIRRATHKSMESRYQSAEDMRLGVEQVMESLPSWKIIQQVVPELGDEWIRVKEVIQMVHIVPVGILRLIIASITTWIVLQSPIMAEGFYLSIFQTVYAPLLIGLIAIFSFPVAVCFIFVLGFPPILISWPSLGLLYAISMLCLSPLVYRYPTVFMSIILLSNWNIFTFVLVLPLIAGYYYGTKGGLIAALLLPMTSHLMMDLPTTQAYQQVLRTPLICSDSPWIAQGLAAIEWSHIQEITISLVNWFRHGDLQTLVFPALLVLGVTGLGRRGVWGLGLFALVGALFTLLMFPDAIGSYLLALALFLSYRKMWQHLTKLNRNVKNTPQSPSDLTQETKAIPRHSLHLVKS